MEQERGRVILDDCAGGGDRVMTTTKLELDKSRRKLTFADCEPGEEIEAALQEAAAANSNYDRMTVGMVEESVLHSILERECIPQSQNTNNWEAINKDT